MRVMNHWRGAALILGGVLLGYLLAPTIAQAAASLVKIQSCCSSGVAAVNATTHRLAVGTSSAQDSIYAVTTGQGDTVLASGSTSTTKTAQTNTNNEISGVSLDVPSNTSGGPVTLTLRKGTTLGSGQVIWEGTVPTVGHIDYTFGNTIYICFSGQGCPTDSGGFNASVSAGAGASVQYEVYGWGFGAQCCLVNGKPAAAAGG